MVDLNMSVDNSENIGYNSNIMINTKEFQMKVLNEYSEKMDGKEVKITRYDEKKRKKPVVKSSSRIQHQKGAFGWSEPRGNGVSSIYFSDYYRVPRNGEEGKSNGKLNPQTRAW